MTTLKRQFLQVRPAKVPSNLARALIDSLQGNGNFYSTGSYIKVLTPTTPYEEYVGFVKDYVKGIKEAVETVILHPKPLVALVNGPCVGSGVALAALFDLVYCSDKAYFWTPFTKVGLCAELCSSYTFPRAFGPHVANQMLLLNYKMSAQEAKHFGFVAKTYADDKELAEVWKDIEKLTKLSQESILVTKKLIRFLDKDALLQANEREFEDVFKLCVSKEAMNQFLKIGGYNVKV